MARKGGWQVNNKRIQRLWRQEGLRVPYRKKKKPHRGVDRYPMSGPRAMRVVAVCWSSPR